MKLDKLDVLFSEYIRKRAMQRVHGCERCLTGKTDYKQLQCSHFIGRARKAVRWDEDNGAGLCPGCHMYLTAHPLEHVQWFTSHIGDVDLLLARNRSKEKPDKNVIAIYLKEQIRIIEGATE